MIQSYLQPYKISFFGIQQIVFLTKIYYLLF